MTREKAIEAGRVVDAIDGFQAFMEEIDMAIDNADYNSVSVDFRISLNALMKTELARLEQVLADL